MLRTVCGLEVLFRPYANWFWCVSDVEDCLWTLIDICVFHLCEMNTDLFQSCGHCWFFQFPGILRTHEQNEKVHIYNRILLSQKKEYIWLSSNKVDEIRGYYTEWSKSEREKCMSYINTCIWSLERWYWWTCLQGSNGDADTVTRLVDTVKEGEGGTNWKSGIKTYMLPHAKLDSQWTLAVWCRELRSSALEQPRGVGCGGRWEGKSRGRGHRYI